MSRSLSRLRSPAPAHRALRSLAPLAVAASALAPAAARASSTPAPLPLYGVSVATPSAPLTSARQLVPDAPGAPPAGTLALARSRTIYLNKNGVTLQPAAVNDARSNRSTIAEKVTTIPPWAIDATSWNTTVGCLRELFAPFAVTLVTEDPGTLPHLEAVFGGTPGLLGLPNNIAGISPFTSSCSVIESSMVFVFTQSFVASPRTYCEVMAQEVAHSYGLDHELLASDPMTYLSFDGRRAFQETLAPCGEYAERPCGIGSVSCRAKQSSLLLLRERLGVSDAVPPTGAILTPAPNAVVEPSFRIELTATDDVAIAEIQLALDGQSVGTLTEPPYLLTLADVPAGEHVLTAAFIDQGRNTVTTNAAITVVPRDTPSLLACQAAPASGGLAVLLGALAARRRRRRRRR